MLAPTWAATTIDVVPAHAGIHTPRLLLFAPWSTALAAIDIGGYGSLLAAFAKASSA